MSPRKDCCVICGYDIRDYGTLEGKWLMEFRAIYSNPEGCFISGVGINNSTDDPLQAPSDPTKRYDDENYDRHLTKEFYVTFCWEQTIAFVSHDACWKLFEEALKPDNIPLKRFIDICSSLPLIQIMGLFHWGHTYGGIYTFDNISAFPWEYSFLDQALDAEALRCARVNPWNIPTLRALMAETAHKPPMAGAPILNESSDCFRQFPWEIREAIANKLSTRDALSLRESSRAFQPLLASSTFWASRFQPGLDREFLFESYRRPEIRDWLSLYRSTSQKRSPPGLKNRTRIWNLINYILPLLKLRLAHDESRDWAYKSHETRLVEADAKLMQLVHRRNGSSNVLNDGCRLLKTQQAHIPQSLDSIALSFIEVGNHGHLTGICFSSKDGMKTQLGYLFPNGTMVYKVEDLSGFVLAIDPKGVRGVKIVHSNGDRSAWFGFPEMTPVTERLRVIDTTKPIRVSVDGYKIIGVAASGPENISNQSGVADISSSLRTTALWYPSIPDQDICLNEQNLREITSLTTKYVPLHWGHFGGPQGAYLRQLNGVSLSYVINPISINFHYATGSQIDITQFGRIGDPDDLTPRPIDGARGEIIETVQVAMRGGGICALKLITTKGREFRIGKTAPPRPRPQFPGAATPEPEPEAKFETLTVAPNTTITGFYAPHIYVQLLNLGITSEATDR